MTAGFKKNSNGRIRFKSYLLKMGQMDAVYNKKG
jgi:hypothetical protein